MQHSNLAVEEERTRLLASIKTTSRGCRNSDCSNYGRDVAEAAECYARFGQTAAGAPRYQCKRCRKTFSINSSVHRRLRKPGKTAEILRLLINKTAMRRLCEVAGVAPETLYQRIDRIHEQCQSIAKWHESNRLATCIDDRLIHSCTDRQEYALNWGSSLDRTTPILRSATTAESRSGYVLAQHLNFDPTVDREEYELAAREVGDPDKPLAYRNFARLRLHEWQKDTDLPKNPLPVGVMVHDSCLLYAHFLYLKELIGSPRQLQFSMDGDPGLDRACLVSFSERIRDGSADVTVLRIKKEMTVSERQTALGLANDALRKSGIDPEDPDLARLLAGEMAKRYRRAVAAEPKPFKRWVRHPYPNMNEPEKQVLCLSDTGERDLDDLGWVLARANLMAIDRYFMQVRRRLSVLERPIATSSQGWRKWRGYNAYNPVVVMKLLGIFRVAYNFHLRGKDRKTPAQRLGLTDRPWSIDDLLAFDAN